MSIVLDTTHAEVVSSILKWIGTWHESSQEMLITNMICWVISWACVPLAQSGPEPQVTGIMSIGKAFYFVNLTQFWYDYR